MICLIGAKEFQNLVLRYSMKSIVKFFICSFPKCHYALFVKCSMFLFSFLGDRISITPEGELHVRDIRDTDGYTDFRCKGMTYVTGIEKSSPPAKLFIHGMVVHLKFNKIEKGIGFLRKTISGKVES